MTTHPRHKGRREPAASSSYRRESETAAAELVRDIKASLVAWLWAILGGIAAVLWLTLTQGNWRVRTIIGIGLVLAAVALGRIVEQIQRRSAGT